MKRFLPYFTLALLVMNAFTASAQTDPGTDNLTHQWTFDSGLPTDEVGGVDGSLVGGATISGKALNTTGGGYLSFSGSDLAVNSYSALSTELWFKSASGQNSGNTMIAYFGDADVNGWMGTNYVFSSPSNGGNCRLAISTGVTTSPWSNENGINNPDGAIDDGAFHHLVSIVSADSLFYYLDGVLIGQTALTGSNALSAVSNSTAFLCKGGYSSDPTWKGAINKYSIYNKVLSADEVLYLYQQGAESSTTIDASKSSFAFDENKSSATFTVSGASLSEQISITAPEGITVAPTTLAADVSNGTVMVTYDKSSSVDGNIVLTSGTAVLYLPVKASVNSSCFTPFYSNVPNLISDPYMGSITSSWGNVSVVSDANVYCGSQCVKITGTASCWPDGGSITSAEIAWLPNTTYRIRAMVKTVDGSFNMGVQNANVDGGSGDYNMLVDDTNGEWAQFDKTFTTGSAPTTGVAFFNNCGSASGLVAYIDNWEIYAVPGITVSASELYVDDYSTTASFTVSGIGLDEDISINVPDGITVDVDMLSASASKETVTITYDGYSTVEGDVVFE